MKRLLNTLDIILHHIAKTISIYLARHISRVKFKENDSYLTTKIKIFRLSKIDSISKAVAYGSYFLVAIGLIKLLKSILG